MKLERETKILILIGDERFRKTKGTKTDIEEAVCVKEGNN